MVEPLPVPEIVIHEIEEVDLRSVFATEHRAFTPWLGRPENLARPARSLGIEIELEATEANSGTFRTDILARNLADGTMVVIENQFGRSDHDHFGKTMTSLAGHDAKTVVWIAEAFADEHRAALTWLNNNTPEDVGFYGVIPRVMRIAGSPPGLRIEAVIAPNTFVKKKKQEERVIDTQIAKVRETFWKLFDASLAADSSLSSCQRRYGGRLGFQSIFPAVDSEWSEDEPHVLVYIQSGQGRQGYGVVLECRRGARPEAQERLQQARDALRLRQITLGRTPADLSEPSTTVPVVLGRVKPALEELSRVFSR